MGKYATCLWCYLGNAKSTSNAKWIFITTEHAALFIPLGLKIYDTISIQGHFFYKEKPSMGAYRKYTRGPKLQILLWMSCLSTSTAPKKLEHPSLLYLYICKLYYLSLIFAN